MIVYGMGAFDWNFFNGFYFAVSTLGTGGLWPILEESSKLVFGITGLFAMIGVPSIGLAMAQVARSFINQEELRQHFWSR